MARFNEKTETATRKAMVPNHEGGLSFEQGPQMELYSLACTSILRDKFYESSKEEMVRLRHLLTSSTIDPEWIAKLAVYIRTEMHLRTMPVVMAVELVRTGRASTDLIRRMVRGIIWRPDEMTEILAYYAKVSGMSPHELKKIPKGIKLGIADAFPKFDAYQLGKWKGAGNAITLQDVIRLTHPRPKTDEKNALYEMVADDTIPAPATWEVELSGLGQQGFESDKAKAAAFRAKWEELVARRGKGSLGYMALLRNLRNLLDAGVSVPTIRTAASTISDDYAVKRSRQLPFRFWSAYKELAEHPSPHTGTLLAALNTAMWASAQNIDFIDESDVVAIAVDTSGSMRGELNRSTERWEVGMLLALMLRTRCKAATMLLFDTDLKVMQVPEVANILSAMNEFRGVVRGGGTNGHLVFRYLNEHAKYDYNKIFMFSDMQVWHSGNRGVYYGTMGHDTEIPKLWGRYATEHPGARLVTVDLAGYGTTPVDTEHGGSAYLVAGWSDRIFKMVAALEGGSSVSAEIDAIELLTEEDSDARE